LIRQMSCQDEVNVHERLKLKGNPIPSLPLSLVAIDASSEVSD